MRRVAAALATGLAALSLAGAAGGAISYGVTEDAGKYARDGGEAFFGRLNDVGLTENAITIFWDPAMPGGMAEPGLLDRVLPRAGAHRVRVILTVYAAKPWAFTRSPTAEAQFTSFLQRLARTYPQVTDFVVGNEPNQPRFWQPQFGPDGSDAAACAYEELLARCYDALKSVNPRIRVIGLGLSERGNDDARASSNASHSPVRFIHDLGAAYYASGRHRPIMDALAYHPYPASSTDPISKGLAWPNAGVPNLDRIKQAVWDAFHGSAQPTFEEGLGLVVSEVGWQVGVAPGVQAAYTGRENVATTDEATQAAIYGELVRRLACDPSVTDLLFLHLIDETDLAGFQSGLERADGSRRPSYDAVKQAIGATGGRCLGKPTAWRHATGVVGGAVGFGAERRRRAAFRRSGSAFATADEGASYVSAFVRAPANGVLTRAAAARALASGDVSTATGYVGAGTQTAVRFAAPWSGPGTYVPVVSLRAEMNPARRSLFLGRPVRLP